jgi:hypothetical protein
VNIFKKILVIATCFIVICTILTSCTKVVSEIPIDTEYIAAYDAMETVYEYKYDWINGEYKLLPVYKQVHHSEVYRVQYKIVYSDGNETTVWRKVDRPTYEEALKIIER